MASWGQVTPAVPGDVTILYGDGTGGFGSPERWARPARGVVNVGDLDLADIDGDGTDDIVADTSEGAMVVYRDLPGFEERESRPRGPINAADFDGDGRVDVAVGSTMYLNRLDRPLRSRSLRGGRRPAPRPPPAPARRRPRSR